MPASPVYGTFYGGSPCVTAGGKLHPIPAAKTPVGAWIAAIVASIDADTAAGVEPCQYCGRYCGCGCDEWIAAMEGAEGCHAAGNAG